MSHERKPGGNQEAWKPNAEFFKSTPRSASIHTVCGDILKRVDLLHSDVEVAGDITRQKTIYAELEMLGGRLIELHITPKMNSGLPIEAYQSDPVITVEWAAGQLYPLTGHNITSETDVAPIVQEFNLIDNGHALIEAASMSEKLRRFLIERDIASILHNILDIPTEKKFED